MSLTLMVEFKRITPHDIFFEERFRQLMASVATLLTLRKILELVVTCETR